MPFRNRVTASLLVKAPLAGYVVPCAWAKDIGARLALHGIAGEKLEARRDGVRIEAFRASAARFATAPFEGRMRLALEGQWQPEIQSIGSGALYVPIGQPLARLVMHLLEPRAPDSFAAWGLFNACFEQKEHVEAYVAEQIAREMLEQQPQLQALFARRLREDAQFAADPMQRLDFFLRRHSSWDAQLNLYPVLRVDEPPA